MATVLSVPITTTVLTVLAIIVKVATVLNALTVTMPAVTVLTVPVITVKVATVLSALTSNNAGSDRPYRPRYNSEGGDRPQRPYGNNAGGDRPYRPRYNSEGGDRSQRPYGNNAGGDRPFRPRYNSNGDRPQRPYGNRDSYGRPIRRTGDYDPNAKYSKKKQIEYKEQFVDPNEPIRLNKFLANAGVCSRREADEFITAGVVSVNGEVVTELGTKIKRGDEVKFHDQTVSIERKIYVLLNKPKDTVTTSDDPAGASYCNGLGERCL